jgi:hypothetical protein
MPTPTYTILHQDSSTIYDTSGNPRFRVVSTVTDVRLGDLPDNQPEVFVFQIVDATDPKQDKFLRVASIHDLSQIIRGRDPARSANKSYYLSSTFTVDYDDVTTAISAKAVVQTRVDALITSWIDYSTKFVIPTDFIMPAPEDTLVTGAKNTYYAARDNNAAKQAALATSIAAFTEAQAAASRASTSLTQAVAASSECTLLSGKLSSFEQGYRGLPTSYRTTMNALITAVPSDPAYDAQLDNAKNAQSYELSVLTPVLTDIIATVNSKCASLTAALQVAAQAKTTADTAAANAQTAQALAQASATAAAAAEAAALAAVMAVCPDFDPNA